MVTVGKKNKNKFMKKNVTMYHKNFNSKIKTNIGIREDIEQEDKDRKQ